jgi:hypothetical protein
MSNRKNTTLAALAIALVPAVSMAERPETKAAQTCVEAFVATLATSGNSAPRLKAAKYYGINDLLGAPSLIELTAVNPRTGLAVARASCELSATGKMLSLKAVPL